MARQTGSAASQLKVSPPPISERQVSPPRIEPSTTRIVRRVVRGVADDVDGAAARDQPGLQPRQAARHSDAKRQTRACLAAPVA